MTINVRDLKHEAGKLKGKLVSRIYDRGDESAEHYTHTRCRPPSWAFRNEKRGKCVRIPNYMYVLQRDGKPTTVDVGASFEGFLK